MNTLVILYSALIYVLVCIMNIQAVNITYSGLEAFNIENLKRCPDRESCVPPFAIPRNASFSEKNCECDEHCSAFEDCCVDARSSNKYRSMGLFCMGYDIIPHTGVYAINTCSRRYAGPIDIKRKCEIEDDFSDPLASAPSTSLPIGLTYRNKYCAECNNAKLSSLVPWGIGVTCQSLESYRESVNEDFVRNNIEYRADLNAWGVEFQGQFHFCDPVFYKPEDLSFSKVRPCRANVISTCPINWRRSDIKKACENYTSVLYAGEDAYRNVHCAICNGRAVRDLNCNGTAAANGTLTVRRRKPFSFPMLVDVNRSNGDIVGEIQRCPSDEVYDPFFKKCRVVRCVIPGYTKVNGNCVKM